MNAPHLVGVLGDDAALAHDGRLFEGRLERPGRVRARLKVDALRRAQVRCRSLPGAQHAVRQAARLERLCAVGVQREPSGGVLDCGVGLLQLEEDLGALGVQQRRRRGLRARGACCTSARLG
jgi:hypothetical protein